MGTAAKQTWLFVSLLLASGHTRAQSQATDTTSIPIVGWEDVEPEKGAEWVPFELGDTECSKPTPEINESGNIFECPILENVCLDQGVVIFQDRRYHPWTSPVRPPVFNITDILWNTPSVLGIGDKWYTGKNRYPQLHIRPWHHMEESDDIREPRFSKCTVPMLFVHHFPFNVAEVYRFAVNNIYFMQKRLKFFDEHVTLVPMIPAMGRLPSYTKFWLQPFSKYEVTTLGRLSQRHPPGAPSGSTGEGTAVRCFRKVILCKITLRKPTAAFFEAGQFVAEYYMEKAAPHVGNFTARVSQELATTPASVAAPGPATPSASSNSSSAAAAAAVEGAAAAGSAPSAAAAALLAAAAASPDAAAKLLGDEGVLKVVFAVRSKSHVDVGRVLLNEDELIARCNAGEVPLPTEPGATEYRSVVCLRHVFGVDSLYDMWLVRQVDVLVGVHGSALTNAEFMRRGSSLIELRPFGFSGRESWPNIYMKSQTRGLEVFWYGIDVMDGALSSPGKFEQNFKPWYTRARGCIARDRNLEVPWAAMRHQLLNIAVVSGSVWRYKVLRHSHAYYITHDIKASELPGRDKYQPVELLTWFTDPEEERRKAMAIALTPEGQAAAQEAEEKLLADIMRRREATQAEAGEDLAGQAGQGGQGEAGGQGGEGTGAGVGAEGGAGVIQATGESTNVRLHDLWVRKHRRRRQGGAGEGVRAVGMPGKALGDMEGGDGAGSAQKA